MPAGRSRLCLVPTHAARQIPSPRPAGPAYTAEVVIDDDPESSALQRLRFWVDTDNDTSFADETELLGGMCTHPLANARGRRSAASTAKACRPPLPSQKRDPRRAA